jgi:hypothetical protein
MICHLIFGPICYVLPAVQRNVDVLSQDFFNMFVMYRWLFGEMRTFCHMIFGPICDVLLPAQQNLDILSQDQPELLFSKMWMFCAKILMVLSEKNKIKNLMRQSIKVTCGVLHVLAEL